MGDVDMKVVEEKIKSGQALSKEETVAVMSEPPVDTTKVVIPDEDFHEEEKESENPKGEAKAEEKPESAKPKETQPEVKEEAKKPIEKIDANMDKIYAELEKPDGQINLTGYSEREKGIFWDLRRERKARQEAEADRDVLKRKEIQREEADKKAAEERKAQEEAKDPFEGRDPEDPVTLKDLKVVIDSSKKMAKKVDTEKPNNVFDIKNPMVQSSLIAWDNLTRKEIGGDYDETLECTAEIISNNPAYLKQVATALVTGDNPAKLIYNLIKGDPEYPKVLPVAQARLKAAGKTKPSEETKPALEAEKKNKEALEAQEKFEKNQKQNKTSAHAGGDGSAGSPTDGYSIEQLVKMSDAEFRLVPKKIREKYLKGEGV